jgi:hypothetical protein
VSDCFVYLCGTGALGINFYFFWLAECSAPKNEFTMANATVDEVLDTTKSGSAGSNN